MTTLTRCASSWCRTVIPASELIDGECPECQKWRQLLGRVKQSGA